MAIRHRTPFAPEFNFVVLRPFTFNGRSYAVGEEFDKANVNERTLRKLYDSRNIDAVIPSFTLKRDKGDAEPERDAEVSTPVAAPLAAPQKPKSKGKRKAPDPEPEPEAAPATSRYRLDENFGVYRIFDGEALVRECATADEAKAAMAELSGE